MTATNSTWENLRPTQERGPSAQGMNAPGSGSMKDSGVILGFVVFSDCAGLSQREGRQTSASGPQILGSVWRPSTLMMTKVSGGSTCVLSFSVKV